MMHAGRIVASGAPDELKKRTIPGTVLGISGPGAMTLDTHLEKQSWVVETSLFGDTLHIQTESGTDAEAAEVNARRAASAAGLNSLSFEVIVPSLEDVFLRIVDRSEASS
jgi:ABC-type multidrug transport system ATPase subunit